MSHRPRPFRTVRGLCHALTAFVGRHRPAGGRHRRTLTATCSTASTPATSRLVARRPGRLPHSHAPEHARGDGIALVRPYVLAAERRHPEHVADSATRRLLIVTRRAPDLPMPVPFFRRQA